jgi:hypothetical protein
MREVEIDVTPPGTAESLELDLTFELATWGHGHGLMESLFEKKVAPKASDRSANVADCQELLGAVNYWMRLTLTETLELDTYIRRLASGTESLTAPIPTVKRLHYGSPFQIEMLLPLLSSAGLTSLFFIARRFYGIDLEFKAYREQRRAEYLEAKAKADQLAAQTSAPTAEMINAPNRWKLTSGTLRDPSS